MANIKKEIDITESKGLESTKKIMTPKTIGIIVCVALAIILVFVYIYVWGANKNKAKLDKSYLLDTQTISLEIKNLDEINQILAEAPTEYFILVSYTGANDVYNLENGLKKIIDDYKLNDSFYYLDITDIKNDDNYLARINNAFNTDKIKKVPVILYYKDGKLVDIVSRLDDNCIKAADFQKLLDQNDFEDQ